MFNRTPRVKIVAWAVTLSRYPRLPLKTFTAYVQFYFMEQNLQLITHTVLIFAMGEIENE